MRREFRNRAFLPVVIPVAVVLAIAGAVALFAWILLYSSHEIAIVLAILMAAGVLLSVSLAASQDDLDPRRRAAVVAAGGTPVLIGVLVALGLGGIPADQLNINREPIQVVPEGAPVIAAENAQTFCNPRDGECQPTMQMTLPAGQETTVVFENNDTGVPHNWTLRPSQDSSESLAATSDGTGPAQLVATVPADLEPGDYYFLCTIHPAMQGTATVSPGATEAAVDADGGGSGG